MRRAAPYLVVLLCLVFYAGIWRLGFAQDDLLEIQYNRYVAGNGRIGEIFTTDFLAGADRIVGYYRPAVVLVKRLLHSLGGGSPVAHHAFNLALHILVCLLLYRWVQRWENWTAALIAAALFAVHPVGVEVVAANTGLKDLLVGTAILALLLLVPELQAATAARRLRLGAAVFAIALFGALGKEQFAVVLPLLALQFLVRRRSTPAAPASARASTPPRKGKAPRPSPPPPPAPDILLPALLVAVPIALAVCGRALFAGGGRLGGDLTPAMNPLLMAPFGVRLLTSGRLLLRALALFVYPAHLSSDYTYNQIPLACQGSEFDAWMGLALGSAGIGLFLLAYLRRDTLALPLGMAIVCWAPVAQVFVLVPQIFAERFLYLFYLPLCFLVGAIVVRAQRWAAQRGAAWVEQVGAVVLGVMILALGVRTALRVPVWRDNDSLLYATAAEAPESVRIQTFLASSRLGSGDAEAAVGILERTLGRPDPCPYTAPIAATEALAHRVLGQSLRELGRFDDARRNLKIATEAQPEYLVNWYEYGLAFDLDQQPQQAARVWEEGLTTAMASEDRALDARTRALLVAWYARSGDRPRMAAHADAVIANPLADAQALSITAQQLEAAGDFARSQRAQQRLPQ